ncbi:uncharacterized protein GIQ15_03595 [Arthroderma uncinatum]|uniref:uncharacterized protein n=1 Tax=Arthroderma uncinatum TaxID=74035 RepID=UPI00144A516C|nr:uncharacterized protein GIQ15_03595 [Arthroderma uncinatum]KAF3484271.1 hypothetical protein GIQ15_03595 [Arthroderma uncinatum]
MASHNHPDGNNTDDDSDFDLREDCFSDGESETDASSASDYGADAVSDKGRSEEGEMDEEDEDDAGRWLQNEEEQRPPDYYLQEETDFDPSTLRTRRYSPNTQLRLDWVKEHWER